MELLKNKNAIVTGAARGIGKAIAQKFAEEGANVALVVRTLDERALSLQSELQQHNIKCEIYAVDVANFDEVHQTITQISADFGAIDILVNNAGIAKDNLMLRMNEQQWDDVINTNLKSAFNFTHAITPIMMRQRNGSIINLSSVVGLHGNAGQANYAASKGGIVALTKSIAREIGARGVRANCIAPGFIDTDMTKAIPQAIRDEQIKPIALKRIGTPEDVANVALFLASDMSAYVTGQVINCCGGMSI